MPGRKGGIADRASDNASTRITEGEERVDTRGSVIWVAVHLERFAVTPGKARIFAPCDDLEIDWRIAPAFLGPPRG